MGAGRSLLGGRRSQNRQIHSVCRQYTANIDASSRAVWWERGGRGRAPKRTPQIFEVKS